MWTPTQKVLLALAPKFSSVLTFLGSSWMITEIVTSKQKRSHIYHRLLLAMSLYDLIECPGNFMSTWTVPKHTMYNQVWAFGNQQTCTLQGFVLLLAVAVPIYNAMLALYYMLVINHNISDRTLRRYFEPTVHIIAFCWSFGVSITATKLQLFNNSNIWCWIAPYPRNCLDSWRYGDQGNCVRGDNAWIYRWAFYFAPLWLCILIATICTISVYIRVRSLDKQTLRYRRPERHVLSVSSVGRSVKELNLAAEEKKDDDFLSGCFNDGMDSSQNVSQPDGMFNRWKAKRAIYKEDYPRTVEVANQAIWYLGVFYIAHIWGTANRTIQQVQNGRTIFGIVLLHATFDPLLGWLNFVVYQRPRYLKIRKAEPDIGVIGAMWSSLRFSFLPPMKRMERAPSGRWNAISSAVTSSSLEDVNKQSENENEATDPIGTPTMTLS